MKATKIRRKKVAKIRKKESRFIRRKKAQKKRFQIANLCLMKMKKRDNVEMTWLMVFGSCVFPVSLTLNVWFYI